MKEYIKYFDSEIAADDYRIVDVPFISRINLGNNEYVNLRTTQENKQISIVGGQPEVTPIDHRLRFVSKGNSSVGLEKLSTGQTVYYLIDSGENWDNDEMWTEMTTATTMVNLTDGQKMYIRGTLTSNNTSDDSTQFKTTGNISLKGNLNYLWNYENLDASLKEYCGYYLFSECTAITDASEMFLGTSATTLPKCCYTNMFSGCTSLTTAPALPATTLAGSCYWSMFEGCSSLTTAPELSATTLEFGCCQNMFKGCTSLTTAPSILPATTLTGQCYSHMFEGCTSLTTAPALPATTLAQSCYNSMFAGCTSLTTAPELPSTTLKKYCYSSMFKGCEKLAYVKCLATDISASSCTKSWTEGVASTGVFIKDASVTSWTTGTDGIPEGWTVQDA